MLEQKLKHKMVNHYMTKGNKVTCEKILIKALKLLQKADKKPHSEIVKLAILNAIPVFRVMELKEKRKKKRKKGTKRAKEIPAFLSRYTFRSSWALKFICDSTRKKSANQSNFFKQLQLELSSTAQNSGEAVKVKTEIQKQALKKKSYFRYYRW